MFTALLPDENRSVQQAFCHRRRRRDSIHTDVSRQPIASFYSGSLANHDPLGCLSTWLWELGLKTEDISGNTWIKWVWQASNSKAYTDKHRGVCVYAKRVSLKSLAATFESLSYLLVLIRACYILQAEALLIRLAVNYYLYFFDLVKESALFNFHGGQSGHYAQVSLTYPLKHRGSSSQRRGHAENQLNASLCPHPPMHCLVLVAQTVGYCVCRCRVTQLSPAWTSEGIMIPEATAAAASRSSEQK